jgi:neutral ceramidase
MNLTIRYQTALLAAFLICSFVFGAVAERGRLQAGAACVDITPPVNPAYPPSGKYEHERLYVRAIVVDNGLTRAALLNADLGNMPEDAWASAIKPGCAEQGIANGLEDLVAKYVAR